MSSPGDRARIEQIRNKTQNARLDWALQSDEPCDLIDDLQFLLDLLASQGAQTEQHDCETWGLEGLGCALCNPAAQDSRNGRLVSQGERRQQEHDDKNDDFARGQTTGSPQSSRTASKTEGFTE